MRILTRTAIAVALAGCIAAAGCTGLDGTRESATDDDSIDPRYWDALTTNSFDAVTEAGRLRFEPVNITGGPNGGEVTFAARPEANTDEQVVYGLQFFLRPRSADSAAEFEGLWAAALGDGGETFDPGTGVSRMRCASVYRDETATMPSQLAIYCGAVIEPGLGGDHDSMTFASVLIAGPEREPATAEEALAGELLTHGLRHMKDVSRSLAE